MNENLCQSCGKPMGQTDDLYGSEKDGSKSKDFCGDCYKNGVFTTKISKERMIEISIPYLLKEKPDLSEAEARKEMQNFFPTLKRWKNS